MSGKNEEYQEVYASGMLPEEGSRIPLTVYIGGEQRIVGEALVHHDGSAECFIDPDKDHGLGKEAVELVRNGGFYAQLSFKGLPATPVVPTRWNDDLTWKKAE